MNLRPLILLSVIFLAAFIWLSQRTAPAQEDQEVIAAGEIEYQRSCATCHGVNGQGRGPMARFLTIEPSDLTQLAKRNSNKFDFWQVYRTIDGREQVRGHGTREMPVWGTRFQAEAEGYDQISRSQVAGRILGLAFYLQYIQER